MEKLRNCIQHQDPTLKKQFLDFSGELNGKIKAHDFRKVGEWVLCVCVSFFPQEVWWFYCVTLSCCKGEALVRFSVRVYSRTKQIYF